MPGKILALAADNVITFSFVAQPPLPVAAPVICLNPLMEIIQEEQILPWILVTLAANCK